MNPLPPTTTACGGGWPRGWQWRPGAGGWAGMGTRGDLLDGDLSSFSIPLATVRRRPARDGRTSGSKSTRSGTSMGRGGRWAVTWIRPAIIDVGDGCTRPEEAPAGGTGAVGGGRRVCGGRRRRLGGARARDNPSTYGRVGLAGGEASRDERSGVSGSGGWRVRIGHRHWPGEERARDHAPISLAAKVLAKLGVAAEDASSHGLELGVAAGVGSGRGWG